jgi:hypothetical protein
MAIDLVILAITLALIDDVGDLLVASIAFATFQAVGRVLAKTQWRRAFKRSAQLISAFLVFATLSGGLPGSVPESVQAGLANLPTVARTGPEAPRLVEVRNGAERTEKDPEEGVRSVLASVAGDLGIGVGWAGLYFITFLVLWRGQTPGKRMLGIRVVHVNGRPITWWTAFERFHGYAASMITGLIGFLQILWDPNRQCLHDRVAETVVIREGMRVLATSPAPSARTWSPEIPSPP